MNVIGSSTRWQRYRVAAVLLGVWALSVALTWGIVENPLYDQASLLHSAERWARGEVPYRDFQPMYPPLSLWLYGLAFRVFSSHYSVAASLAALLALLNLLAHYRLARLFLRRRRALTAAVAVYLLLFACSSANGPNFLILPTVFLGTALFSFFVYAVARELTDHRRRWLPSLVAGALAGLCLLHKHEQMAGVAAVCLLLIAWKFWRGFNTGPRLLLLLSVMALIAAAGYAGQAAQSGWFYLRSALQAYGTAREHAMRNFPSLMTIVQQVLLALIHAGLLAVCAAVAHRPHPTQGRLVAAGLGLAAAGGFGLLAAGIATCRRALAVDWDTVTVIPNSVAVFGMLARGADPVRATLQYVGGIVFRNVLPMALVWLALGTILGGRIRRTLQAGRRPGAPLARLAVVWAALGGLQVRAVFTYSSYGTFELALPALAVFGATLLPRRLRPGAAAFQHTWLRGCLLAGLCGAVLLYAYEFRDARWRPRVVNTEHGVIRVPRTPECLAFADMVEFVRRQRAAWVLSVPHEGMQYWTGGRTPFEWTYILHPGIYHAPWSTGFERRLAARDFTFIVHERADAIALYLPELRKDWREGPWYPVYRWKEAWPALWARIRKGRLLARFPAHGPPFFSVYQAGAHGLQ